MMPTRASGDDNTEWVFQSEMAEMLGIDWRSVKRVAAAGNIRTTVFPGQTTTRYCREDVERVAKESIIDPGARAGRPRLATLSSAQASGPTDLTGRLG